MSEDKRQEEPGRVVELRLQRPDNSGLLETLDALREGVESGEVKGLIVIALTPSGEADNLVCPSDLRTSEVTHWLRLTELQLTMRSAAG